MQIDDPNSDRSYFSKRLRRFDEANQPRELTFSCFRGFRFLNYDRVRNWFLESLAEASKEWNVTLWAYVIMPEHVHLVIQPGVEERIVSKFVSALKEPVARKAVAHLKESKSPWLDRISVRDGDRLRHRFWQPGGGYDRNILCVPTLRAMIEYIHANPVRRGLVDDALQWEWSSAKWFAGVKPCKLEMDTAVLEILSQG